MIACLLGRIKKTAIKAVSLEQIIRASTTTFRNPSHRTKETLKSHWPVSYRVLLISPLAVNQATRPTPLILLEFFFLLFWLGQGKAHALTPLDPNEEPRTFSSPF